jgi:hypothetical protein
MKELIIVRKETKRMLGLVKREREKENSPDYRSCPTIHRKEIVGQEKTGIREKGTAITSFFFLVDP